ncbi:unnamed protein product, partial [Rotaria sp. Silwood1]
MFLIDIGPNNLNFECFLNIEDTQVTNDESAFERDEKEIRQLTPGLQQLVQRARKSDEDPDDGKILEEQQSDNTSTSEV